MEAADEGTEEANSEEEDDVVVKERDVKRGDVVKEGKNAVDEDVKAAEEEREMGRFVGECVTRRGRQDDGNAETGERLGRAQ